MRLIDVEHNERTDKITAIGNSQLADNRGGYRPSELHTTIGDYRDIEILPDSVVYADPPYFSTRGYGDDESFDHEAFYDWCENQKALVLISEFWMPEDRFVCIAEFNRKSSFSATNNSLERIEKIFVPIGQLELYKRLTHKE